MALSKIADSRDVLSTQLMVFNSFPTNSGIEKIQWVDHHPENQLDEDSPIEFNISGTGPQYTDLKRSRLYAKVKVVKEDGSSVPKEESVAPVNLYLQSLFRQIDVFLQEQLLSSTGVNYAYNAILDVLLNCGNEAETSQLESQLFYKDSAGFMDSTSPITADNTGLFYRHQYSEESKVVDMEGPLYEGVFQLDRYLLNGINIRIKLHQSSNAFRLMSNGKGYKVVLLEAKLRVCKVTVSPDVMVAHASMLKSVTAKYPYYRPETRIFSLSPGQYSFSLDNLFNGRIPTKLVMVMMKSEAYAGSYRLNPFNFIHNNLNYLSVDIDGQSVPAKPLQPKFSIQGGQNYISAFQALFSHMWNTNQGNNIARSDFPSGYSIFVFDIEPDIEEKAEHILPLIKTGNLRVEGRFEIPSSDPVTVLFGAKFPAQFEVDETRSILL